MSWSEVAARARGLSSRLATDEVLAAIDRARDAGELARALADVGVAAPVHAATIEREVCALTARELALLSRRDRTALAAIELDEDRRTLRAIVRGMAAEAPGERRLEGAIATTTLPAAELPRLAAATSPAALVAGLARLAHPFAVPLATVETARGAVDVLGTELALAHAFAAQAGATCDREAMRVHVAQVIDVENAAAALQVASRGAELRTSAFVDGGRLVDRAIFAATCADASSPRLAVAFAGTPLAAALVDRAAVLEDAALTWHLATQTRLRRLEPEGPATVLYHVLRRRLVSRHVRRAAWRLALVSGGRR